MKSLSAPPRAKTRSRRALFLLSGLLLPAAVAAALVPLRQHFADTAAALVLVAVVVGVASRGGRWPGWAAAVSSGVWFDFFLTRPYERMAIDAARDIETTAAIFAVGLVVSEIAEASRRNLAVAMSEGTYLALIRELSDVIATGAPVSEVIAWACSELAELLDLDECHFDPRSDSRRPRLERTAEVEVVDAGRVDVGRDGLPSGEVELVVQHRGDAHGVFVMSAGRRRGLTIEERLVALAVADRVGSVLAAPSR